MGEITLEKLEKSLKPKEAVFLLYCVYKINEQKRSKLKVFTALNCLSHYDILKDYVFAFYRKDFKGNFKALAFGNVPKDIIDAYVETPLLLHPRFNEFFVNDNTALLETDSEKEPAFSSEFLKKTEIKKSLIFKSTDRGLFIVSQKTEKPFTESTITFLKHFVEFILTPALELAIDNERNFNTAIRDPLTNLYNRGYLDLFLEKQIKFAERNKSPISLILIDIDHFKNYNDINGHQKGDKLLIELTQLLQNNIRGYDIAARYGGEEFLLVLPHANSKGASRKAEKIRLIIKDHKFFNENLQPEGDVTISLGVANCPLHAKTPQELIEKADLALYKSKSSGRNKVTVYSKKLEKEKK